MFSIDFPEVVIIFGVALIVLGRKKLPGAAAQIGRWVGLARAMARQFREQLEQEVASAENALDVRKSLDSVMHDAAPKEPPLPGVVPHEPAPGIPPQEFNPGHEPPASGYDTQAGIPPREPEPTPRQEPLFDAQLHDTALPGSAVPREPPSSQSSGAPEDAAPAPRHGAFVTSSEAASGGIATSEAHSARAHSARAHSAGPHSAGEAQPADAHSPVPGMQAWLPETQTWMAGFCWEPDPAQATPPYLPPRPPQHSGRRGAVVAGSAPPPM